MSLARLDTTYRVKLIRIPCFATAKLLANPMILSISNDITLVVSVGWLE